MKSYWLWIILMLIWIVLGWWLCKKYLCGSTIATGAAAAAAVAPAVTGGDSCNTFNISDINDFNVNINRNVNFLRSNHVHLNNYSVVGNAMNQVANYLSGDATRKLDITGYYDSGENNSNSAFANLGLSRADDVKAWLISQGGPAGQINTSSRLSSNCYSGDTLRRGVAFKFSSL